MLDDETIESIKNLDENGNVYACGELPIRVLIDIAKKKKWKPEVLVYRNSGDVSGENSALLVIQVLFFMLNEEKEKYFWI